MTDEMKERILNNAKERLANVLREGLKSGLTYEDVCKVVVETINSYKQEDSK